MVPNYHELVKIYIDKDFVAHFSPYCSDLSGDYLVISEAEADKSGQLTNCFNCKQLAIQISMRYGMSGKLLNPLELSQQISIAQQMKTKADAVWRSNQADFVSQLQSGLLLTNEDEKDE